MQTAQQLSRKNRAEHLLYLWQVEDILRACNLDFDLVKKNYLAGFRWNEKERKENEKWYADLCAMMQREGLRSAGHLQIHQNLLSQLEELHRRLLSSPEFPYYREMYYKVLPYIVELRNRGANKEENEIETCFNSLYGMMMLRLQKKAISPDTAHAVKEITTLIGMLNDYYFKEKREGLKFED